MANKEWSGGSSASTTAATQLNDGTNWNSTGNPTDGDNIRVPAKSAYAITGNTTAFSPEVFEDFIVEAGYSKTIGVTTGAIPTYLEIPCNRFEFAGTGQAFIDLGSTSISGSTNLNCVIKNTASPGTGEHGLYLKGTGINSLEVQGGNVGVCALLSDSTSIVNVCRVTGDQANVTIGEQCSITTFEVQKGEGTLRSGSTTLVINAFGGTVNLQEQMEALTVVARNGTVNCGNTGTIKDIYAEPGGFVDLTVSGTTRAVTNIYMRGGRVKWDSAVVNVGAIHPSTNGPTEYTIT